MSEPPRVHLLKSGMMADKFIILLLCVIMAVACALLANRYFIPDFSPIVISEIPEIIARNDSYPPISLNRTI